MDLNVAEDFSIDLSDISPEDLTPPPPNHPPRQTFAATGSKLVSRTGADISRLVFLDIETIPDETRVHLFDEAIECVDPPLTAIQVRKGSVDDIKEFMNEHGDTLPDQFIVDLRALETSPAEPPKTRTTVLGLLSKLQAKRQKEIERKPKLHATTPEYCRIISLAIAVGDGPPVTLVVGQVPQIAGYTDPLTETNLLEFFWTVVEAYSPIVTFNGNTFDIPAICVRSALLGVKPTRVIKTGPWSSDSLDLMQARFPRSKPMGLKTLAKLYGLKDYGDIDGSHVAELYKTDPAAVGVYNACDVERLRDLFAFLSGYFWF